MSTTHPTQEHHPMNVTIPDYESLARGLWSKPWPTRVTDNLYVNVESALTPAQRRSAYARFVGANPRYQGAYWADILADLDDHDAHLDIIDAGVAAVDITELVAQVTLDYLGPATLSLYYADGEIPSPAAVIALAVAAEKQEQNA